MGVSVSVMRLEGVRVPSAVVADFVDEMAMSGLVHDYPAGAGGSCVPFTQRKALGLLDRYVERRSLSPEGREEIENWLASLPWEGGWLKTLPSDADEADDERDEERDEEEEEWDEDEGLDPRNGGRIELYFDW